jgi:hypothetical protein
MIVWMNECSESFKDKISIGSFTICCGNSSLSISQKSCLHRVDSKKKRKYFCKVFIELRSNLQQHGRRSSCGNASKRPYFRELLLQYYFSILTWQYMSGRGFPLCGHFTI